MPSIDLSQGLDTLVVAARPDGFQRVFLGEGRWYAVKLNPDILSSLKYIAPYISAPVSAITCYARIAAITPWEGGPKYCVQLDGSPTGLAVAIRPSIIGKLKSVQDRRYTTLTALLQAGSLDDVFKDLRHVSA
jgi:hypothetical protein